MSCLAHHRVYKLCWSEEWAINKNATTAMPLYLNKLNPLETRLTEEITNESIWSRKSFRCVWAFTTVQKVLNAVTRAGAKTESFKATISFITLTIHHDTSLLGNRGPASNFCINKATCVVMFNSDFVQMLKIANRIFKKESCKVSTLDENMRHRRINSILLKIVFDRR